jgi:hypothetical protein
MRLHIFVLAAALALAAGCNKGPDQAKPSASADKAPSQPQVNTPTTPASGGSTASQEEKKEGANPVQGQVDPKAGEQQRDFKQRGDSAGPKGPDTEPKPGK